MGGEGERRAVYRAGNTHREARDREGEGRGPPIQTGSDGWVPGGRDSRLVGRGPSTMRAGAGAGGRGMELETFDLRIGHGDEDACLVRYLI